MEAEQVIQKILSDARAEAETIKKEAEAKAAAEQAQADEKLAQFERETEALAAQAAEDEKAHLLAAARMEAAKQYLAEKVKILDDVFDQVRRQFRELSDKQYRDVMGKLMAQAVETGDEQVIAASDDARIDGKLVEAVNGRLKAKGKLKLAAEKEPLPGGFVLKRGQIRTNVSIDVLVDRARNDLIIELAKDLFPQDADRGQS